MTHTTDEHTRDLAVLAALAVARERDARNGEVVKARSRARALARHARLNGE